MAMYGVLHRYATDPRAVDEVIRRVDAGVALRVQAAPGFVSHRILDLRNGVLLSIAAFDTEESAREWACQAAAVRDQRLGSLLIAPPEIVVGRTHDRKQPTTTARFSSARPGRAELESARSR